MTRKMFILIALIFLGSALAAQSITVTSPNNGTENWVIGGPNQTISWTFSGYPAGPPPVKLVLFKDGIDPAHKLGNIVENISIGSGGNGSYSWVVGRYDGGTAAAGTGYYIRVIDMNGTARDESDHPFTLSGSPGASITVTAPNAATSWRPGIRQTISWTKSGTMPAMVQITLRREGAPETEDPVLGIVDGCANNGSRDWFIPDSLAEGRYFVRIRASATVRGDSAVFSISASGDRGEVAGPDTWIRCDLELAGVGVEYNNGNIVAWVKNNGPETMRDHDVRFRLNYPEGGAGEQIYTHRITVANGAEKSVSLLAYPGQIPDAGLRTIVSIDTAGSHIQDSNRHNQHRDVHLCALDIRCDMDNLVLKKVYSYVSRKSPYKVEFSIHVRHNLPRAVNNIRIKHEVFGPAGLLDPTTRTDTIPTIEPGSTWTKHIEIRFGDAREPDDWEPKISPGTRYRIVASIEDPGNAFCDTAASNDSAELTFRFPD